MEKRMMGPKPEKTTFCSKRSALGGSGAEGEGGAEGVGAVGLEYLSSSGCSNLGKAEKSGELCRDETAQRENGITAGPQILLSLPLPTCNSRKGLWSGDGEAWFPVPAVPLFLCPGMSDPYQPPSFPTYDKVGGESSSSREKG